MDKTMGEQMAAALKIKFEKELAEKTSELQKVKIENAQASQQEITKLKTELSQLNEIKIENEKAAV